MKIVSFLFILLPAITAEQFSMLHRIQNVVLQLQASVLKTTHTRLLSEMNGEQPKTWQSRSRQNGPVRMLQVNETMITAQPPLIEHLNRTHPAKVWIHDGGVGTANDVVFIFDGEDERTEIEIASYSWNVQDNYSSWVNIEDAANEVPIVDNDNATAITHSHIRLFGLVPSNEDYELVVRAGYATYEYKDLVFKNKPSSSAQKSKNDNVGNRNFDFDISGRLNSFVPFFHNDLGFSTQSKVYVFAHERFMAVTWKDVNFRNELISFQMIGLRGGTIVFNYRLGSLSTSASFEMGLYGMFEHEKNLKVEATGQVPGAVLFTPIFNKNVYESLPWMDYGFNITDNLILHNFVDGTYEMDLPLDYPPICGQLYEGIFDIVAVSQESFQTLSIPVIGNLFCKEVDDGLGGLAISAIVVASAGAAVGIGVALYFLVIGVAAGDADEMIDDEGTNVAQQEVIEHELIDDPHAEEAELEPEDSQNDWPEFIDEISFNVEELLNADHAGDGFFDLGAADKEYDGLI